MGRTGVLRQQHVLGGRNPWGEPGVLVGYRAIDAPRHYGFWFLVSAPKARLAARRAATHFCGSREGGLRCGRVRQAAAIPSGNAVAANMAASCIGRRPAGPLSLSCPSPERLSCERQALCECFEYLSPINRVFGSTLLETERSSITTSAERPMRAAILRAPPGAGKASPHATTRADPCRELPAPDVDNLSLRLITSRDQSEQKPETRTQIPFRFAVPT